jgi:hypothetical protein
VDAFGVGQHVVVPEAEDAVAFAFDHGGSGGVCGLGVLAAVYFYDQFCADQIARLSHFVTLNLFQGPARLRRLRVGGKDGP